MIFTLHHLKLTVAKMLIFSLSTQSSRFNSYSFIQICLYSFHEFLMKVLNLNMFEFLSLCCFLSSISRITCMYMILYAEYFNSYRCCFDDTYCRPFVSGFSGSNNVLFINSQSSEISKNAVILSMVGEVYEHQNSDMS